MSQALMFALIFTALLIVVAGVDTLLDRVLAGYRRRLGGDPQSATEWSRHVESVRTRIEAQSVKRFLRGEAPLDKDAELRKRLGVADRA
jgi:hypothetical protein